MITEFKDYNELPFSKEIQKELFNRHMHVELVFSEDEIVYTERDVLILMQMLQQEFINQKQK